MSESKQRETTEQPPEQISGHEWRPINKDRGYCSCGCGLDIGFLVSREEWQAHLASVAQVAQPMGESRESGEVPPGKGCNSRTVITPPPSQAPQPPEVPAEQRQSYAADIHRELQDPQTAIDYLKACERDSPEALQVGLRDVLAAAPAAPAGTSQGLEAQLEPILENAKGWGLATNQTVDILARFICTRDAERDAGCVQLEADLNAEIDRICFDYDALRDRERTLREKLEGALNSDGDWESREAAIRAALSRSGLQ